MIALLDIRNEEDQLLRADPDSICVFEHRPAVYRSPIELGSVAATEILDRRCVARQVDSGVPPRKHRVVECHGAHRASADDDLFANEVDLLQMKP
jgi:hypothetical protein